VAKRGADKDTPQGIADKVKAQVKKCWIPQVEETEDVSKVESKFGGIPALKEGELWPPCPNCSKDLTLFLQLNLAELPAPIQSSLGSKGVFQAFLCCTTECDGCIEDGETTGRVLRVWDHTSCKLATGVVNRGAVPLAAKCINAWKSLDDYPGYEDCQDAGLDLDDDECDALQDMQASGDKLGGWPTWVQSAEWANCSHCGKKMVHLFQIESEAAVDYMWGDAGNCHIQMCPNLDCHSKGGSFDLDWACS
jgi:uncharacterized protein YwqG